MKNGVIFNKIMIIRKKPIKLDQKIVILLRLVQAIQYIGQINQFK
jgi:hypothetical protein